MADTDVTPPPSVPTLHFAEPPASYEVDGDTRKRMELDHHGDQWHEWQDLVSKHLTERERADLFAHYALDVVWDRLSEHDQDRALRAAAADREWPGTFERMAEENERSWNESAEEERARVEELRRGMAEQMKLLDRNRETLENIQKNEQEIAEIKQREEEEERERRVKEERERLRAEATAQNGAGKA